MGDGEACLVSRNDPMHDSVAYLRNNLPDETDILHEYFVPRDRIVPFIDALAGRCSGRRTSTWSTPRSARSTPSTMR